MIDRGTEDGCRCRPNVARMSRRSPPHPRCTPPSHVRLEPKDAADPLGFRKAIRTGAAPGELQATTGRHLEGRRSLSDIAEITTLRTCHVRRDGWMRVVDPSFGLRLRELRTSRGWSLRQLASQAFVSKSQISEWETGRRRPTLVLAETLDQALSAGGELAALVVERPTDELAAAAIASPRTIDAEQIAALAGTLAYGRQLDDSLPASVLLPAIEGQLATMRILAREVRGPAARDLHLIAIQYGQFAGWLNAQVRNDKRAESVLSTTARDALDLEHPDLACQTLSFRGALDWFRGNAKGMARWNIAAYEVAGASDLHRADAAFNAVHAIGAMGNRQEALRLLGEADDIATAVDGTDAFSPVAYWLSPGWLRLSIGLAHLGLGNHHHAAESLRAGLDGWQDAEWSAEYRDALALAEAAE